MAIDRWTRLVLAAEYALFRYQRGGSVWWFERAQALDRELQKLKREAANDGT